MARCASIRCVLISFIFVLAIIPKSTNGAIINGDFESGDLKGYGQVGTAFVSANLVGSTSSNTALLTSGDYNDGPGADASAVETFLKIKPSGLDAVTNGAHAVSGSAIDQSFSAIKGQVLSLDWVFITSEPAPSSFNDFGFLSLNGAVQKLADTNSFLIKSPPYSFSARWGTPTQHFAYTIPESGTYLLGLGVMQVNDRDTSSHLVVDNIVLSAGVPEPGMLMLMTVCVIFCGQRRSGRRRMVSNIGREKA